ncbi:MAG: sugar ABC transporter permease [Anaerolineae bacterium]
MTWWRKVRRSREVEGILFILPYGLVWLVFLVLPVLYGFYISLFRWQPLLGSTFLGLKNYLDLARDPRFWNAFRNTGWFALITIPLILGIGLFFALLLRALGRWRGNGLVESSFFYPYLLNVSIVSIVWKWLLDPDFGLVLAYLRSLGLNPPTFLNHPLWAIPAIAFATGWWLAGYRMVIFRAAIEDIPPEIFEMAEIDGVGTWSRLWRITLPLLKPALLFSLVLTAISGFSVLGQVLMMTAGGPGRASEVMALYLYRLGWEAMDMGKAAAIGFVLFLVILAFTLVGFRFLGFESEM